MRRKKNSEFLTEVELEFMSHLWALEQASVRELLGQLPEERSLAYTSAATIMRILEEKGFVKSRRDGKTFIYTPTVEKDDYQSRSLRDLSRKLFDGTPASLVARLVDDEGLSVEALEEIRAMVDRKLKDDGL
ncbi:BlaI/MecI/CopY family transcriptional regulator [Algicella marina]|uniref:BlaI/MecI/CopY family transcriptional regulator n=1 Tax=Algicella marina TaxID=2683284 RepID=A0A6P1SZG0_9RHOB|nr:BlaI/MecI/CopY family transcriptional regulator [Algicella marina]QHQ35858.1 BlaI/MecI/CopY family transcriptional regulator [Algicella marina]